MADLINVIVREFGVIYQAPISFTAVVVAAFILIWWAMVWRYNGVIAHKNSEIDTLKTERDAYKSKSGGASPDEIKLKLDELAEMSRYTVGAKWEPLQGVEISELAQKFALISPRRIQVMCMNYRGKDLAQTFVEALTKAGWSDIHFSEGSGLGFGVSTGRGNEVAIAMKEAIEQSTKLKVSSIGPTESDMLNVCFIAVGINTA